MGDIKYYHLAKDEEPPDEFCAIRDVGGEPSEYTFYAPESENAKLRELVRDMWHWIEDSNACDVNEHGEAMNCAYCGHYGTVRKGLISCKLYERMRELGVEVPE